MTHLIDEPSLGDLLHAISRLDEKVDRVVVQTTLTNGRVSVLEHKDVEREKREAVSDALAKMRDGTFMSKKQFAALLGGVGLLLTGGQMAIGLLR